MNDYDRVLYAGGAFTSTHPERLASVAALFGLDAPPPEGARVLELGCGTGANLIPMAAHSPGAEFVGIDLAETPIAVGRARIQRIGLTNIVLEQDDVTRLGASMGTFDYVIAHGLYSWVPPEVRPHVLRVIGDLLAENGVAYVSYNALPGCRQRHLVRDLIHSHFGVRRFEPEQVGAVRDFLQSFARIEPRPGDTFLAALLHEIEYVLALPEHVFYHDDLAPDSYPFLFSDFVRDASVHGLQYLGEAEIHEMYTLSGQHDLDDLIDGWSGGERIAREQHLDWLRGRRFRRTLLCRSEHTLRDVDGPRALRRMHLRSPMHPESIDALHDRSRVAFATSPRGAHIDEPIAKVAVAMLGARYPDTVPFETLFEAALADCAAHGLAYDRRQAGEALAALCWAMVRADLVTVCRAASVPVHDAGERPRLRVVVADALAHGLTPTTPTHEAFELSDETAVQLALALDGTRDRAALVAMAGAIAPRAEGSPTERIDAILGFLRRADAFEA